MGMALPFVCHPSPKSRESHKRNQNMSKKWMQNKLRKLLAFRR